MSRRSALVCAAVVASFAMGVGFACVPGQDDEQFRGKYTPTPEAWIPSPLAEAYCEVLVTGKGIKDMETDYLPRVITCENGGANLEALKAQAIAARSVVYQTIATHGEICDSQGCQVYTCAAQPSDLAYQAVAETSGLYLNYNNVVTYAFYVAGDNNTAPPSCIGTPGVGTENWVTYNEGMSGDQVEQTALGWEFNLGEPGYGQNRGCMSQWGARCLENNHEYTYEEIIRFYYGADVSITQAQGACILDLGGDGDGDGDGDPSTGDGDGDPSTGDGDGDPSTGDGGVCELGASGCPCTNGGGCDPGLTCAGDVCVPESGDEQGDGGESSGETTAGFADDTFESEDGCTCSADGDPRRGAGGVALLGLLGLFGLQRQRRRAMLQIPN